ncbi:MAG: hypothetical protein WDM88_05800 [Galbitalea sp.]
MGFARMEVSNAHSISSIVTIPRAGEADGNASDGTLAGRRIDGGPAARPRPEQLLDHAEGGIHPAGAQPRAPIEDVVERLILTNEVDAARIAVEAALTHEDGDDADFAGSHADLGERDLGTVGEVAQVLEPIGDIGRALKNLVAGEAHIAPRLGVDDQDPGWPDDHEVDVRVA